MFYLILLYKFNIDSSVVKCVLDRRLSTCMQDIQSVLSHAYPTGRFHSTHGNRQPALTFSHESDLAAVDRSRLMIPYIEINTTLLPIHILTLSSKAILLEEEDRRT